MNSNRSGIADLILAGVVALVALPFLGIWVAAALACTAFAAWVLVGSGYSVLRTLAWAATNGMLFASGALAPRPLAEIGFGLGAILWFAIFLLPAARRWWFGR
jgi:hypothetical protein